MTTKIGLETKSILTTFFKTNILKKSVSEYYNLSVHKKESFSDISRELMRKNVIEQTQNTINNIFKYHEIDFPRKENIKIFLSCLMIEKHPHVLLSDETEIELKVQEKAKYLVSLLYKLSNKTNNYFTTNLYGYLFIKNFNNFIILFNEWKDLDKQKIINDLHTIYFEIEADKVQRIEESSTSAEKKNYHEVFIKDIEREQKKIVQKIKNIGGEEAVNNFEKLKTQIKNYKESISKNYKTINDIIHKAFWDNITEELSKDPPNTLVIIPLLDDVKLMLKNCTPNRKDIHDELESKIDTPYIADMIKHNVIGQDYIYNMVNYIFGLVIEYQSKNNEAETKKVQKKMLNDLRCDVYYKDFFPAFFKKIFGYLENILKDIEILKSTELYQLIKDAKNNKD